MRHLLSIATLTLCACTAQQANVTNTALPPGCAGLETSILAFEPTRAGLRAAYGDADSVAAVAVPNRHVEGVTDTLFTVHYPGLTVDIHTPGGGSDLVSAIAIENNRYIAFPRIGIGVAADSVMTLLGTPTARDGADVIYDCGEAVNQPVHFEIADARVRRIVIEYYVD